jgi:hypothetical protein
MDKAGAGSRSPILTKEDGIAIWFINDTGADSVKGTILEPSSLIDLAVSLEETGGINPIGVMYSDGIPDGEPVLVVISGLAEVLVDAAAAVTRGYWAGTSDTTAGRAQVRNSPPATVAHDQEIGHYMESKAGGPDVLAKIIVHFR